MLNLIIISLYVFCVGLFTSLSVLGIFHALILIAAIWTIINVGPKKSFSYLPKSSYFLFAFFVVVIISLVLNVEDTKMLSRMIRKSRHIPIGILSIIPMSYLFESLDIEKLKTLLKRYSYTIICVALIATLSGLCAFLFGLNPLRFGESINTHRNSGLSSGIMPYAHNMAFVLSMLVYWIYEKKVKDKKTIISSIILAIGLFTSYTRGAILAFLSSLVFLNKKVFIALAITAVVGTATVSIVSPDFVKRHLIRKGSNDKRMGCWLGAVEATKENLLFGIGLRNYEEHSVEIKERHDIQEADFKGHAHNSFLEVTASTGIIGFIFFILWLGLWLVNSLGSDIISRLSFGFIITFITGSMTQSTIIDSQNLFFIFTIYALHTSLRNVNTLKEL